MTVYTEEAVRHLIRVAFSAGGKAMLLVQLTGTLEVPIEVFVREGVRAVETMPPDAAGESDKIVDAVLAFATGKEGGRGEECEKWLRE